MAPELVGPILLSVTGVAVISIAGIVARIVLRAATHESRIAEALAAANDAVSKAERAERYAGEAREYASKRADAVFAQYQQREGKARHRAKHPETVEEVEEAPEPEPQGIVERQAKEMEEWARNNGGRSA